MKKMTPKLVWLAPVWLLLSPMVFAQSAGNKYAGRANADYNYNINNVSPPGGGGPASSAEISNRNLLTIKVNGLMNVMAEDYVATFNLVQTGADIVETDELMNQRIENFKANLLQAGLDSSAFKTDVISFVPKYTFEVEQKVFSKNHIEVPAGFELQKNVLVHFRQSQLIDKIMSAAAQAEIYDLVKVDYFIKDLEQRYDTLMAACMKEVKERQKLHEELGFQLDSMPKAISTDFKTTMPGDRYFSYKSFCRPTLPTKRNGSAVKVSEAEKTASLYFDAVDYQHYDVVLNTVIKEPEVQLSYSITVQYYPFEPKPRPEPKNNYFILLENGDLKQIQLNK